MRKTIFIKAFSGYVFIALGLSALVLFFSYTTIKQSYLHTFTNELTDLCKVVSPQALAFIKAHDASGLDQFVKKFDIQSHKRITIIDMEGNVIADSEADPKTMSNHKNRPEVQQVLRGHTGKSLRYSSTVKESMLYIAVPLELNNNRVGILRSSIFLKDIQALLNDIMAHIIGVAGVILFVSLIFAFLFSKSISGPIARLTEASKKIAAGDFTARVSVHGNDELKELAHNFNQMAERISSLFHALSAKKEELHTTINSITEGLVVIGPDDKIQYGNSSFKKIAQSNDVDGKYYWEVLRLQGFKELIEKARQRQEAYIDELEIREQTYACSVVPAGGGNGQVVVLHNITQIKNLERKKREFVANVSHELRTPLAAIQGFAETLEDETTPEGRRYIAIMKKHAERLMSIVEDLLRLSALEEKGFALEVSKTDMKALIESVIKIFKPKAADKNLAIRFDSPDNLQPIDTDPFRMEQVAVNLIDNAIRYTDKGSIEVSLQQDANQTTLTVADTGIGIPQEHLPFIFERFYVADKSRSRKSGGTGLGLSIVKHIVMLHNGSITVESALPAGSRFVVTLPRK